MLFTGVTEEGGHITHVFPMDAVESCQCRTLHTSCNCCPRTTVIFGSGKEIEFHYPESVRFVSVYTAWHEDQSKPQYIVSLP